MRYLASIHAPNISYLTTPEELLRLARSGLVGLDIWFLSTVNFDGIESTVYEWLRRRLGPDALLGVRMYTEHWPDKPAADWADECADHLALIPGLLDDPNVVVSPFNEPDLENEGLPWSDPSGPTIGDYRFIWRYQYAKDEHGTESGWLPRMKQRLPNAKIRYGTAPLAGGHNPVGYPPDWEYAMPEAKACINAFDVHWLHQYIPREATADGYGWQEDKDGYWHGLRLLRPAGYQQDVQGLPLVSGRRDPGGAMVQYPGKLAIISEWGNWHHDDPGRNALTLTQFRYCYDRYSQTGRVLMICPFIYNSGPEHGGNVMGGNIDLMHGLQTIDYPAADWPPQEDDMWDRHVVFDGWFKTFGAEGFNPNTAFGAFREAHPEINQGLIVKNIEKDTASTGNAIYYQYTTTGIYWCYENDWSNVHFVNREHDLPVG